MLALSDDPPVIHYHYHVGADNRAESVGYDKSRSVVHDFLDSVMDLGFAVGIDLTGGFVKNQDRRILEDCSGNYDSLKLSAA